MEQNGKFWGRWRGAFILGVLAGTVIWGTVNYGSLSDRFVAWQAERKARAEYEARLRADTYGGSTPEETFDMFIAALEEGDTNLASKYFVLEKQERWEKTLDEYKKQDLLDDFAEELKDIKSRWTKKNSSENGINYFEYEVIIESGTKANIQGAELDVPGGTYTNNSRFELYPKGNWKINLL